MSLRPSISQNNPADFSAGVGGFGGGFSRGEGAQQVGGRGFTLVEMLVVLGIIAILIGVSVPMFSRLGSGLGLQHSSELVAASVAEARMLARSRSSRAALVFQSERMGGMEELCWRRCAVFVEEENAERELVWKAQENWVQLPYGVVFASQENGLAPLGLLDLVERIEVRVDRGRGQQLAALIFDGRGSLELSAALAALTDLERKQALCLYLRSGVVVDGGELRWRGKNQALRGVRIQQLSGATQEFLAWEGEP